MNKYFDEIFNKMQGSDYEDLKWLFNEGVKYGKKSKKDKHKKIAFYQTTFSRIYQLISEIQMLKASLAALDTHWENQDNVDDKFTKNLIDKTYMQLTLSFKENDLKILKEKTEFDVL